mmetsp:Transcript_17138/g.31018  ORF Transcript_17138/g.31018 Transcript_17138/m.31018 type:complete len:159 (-) Transcript_17138:923-1399(-)
MDANVESKNKFGRTPLYLFGKLERARNYRFISLLGNGAKVNVRDEDVSTPLHEASKKGYRAIVSSLLEKGADVNAKDYYGSSPHREACDYGQEVVVLLLLENGADPTNTDNKGRTPLQIAQENDKHDCVAAIERFPQRQAENKCTCTHGIKQMLITCR